MVAGYLFAEHGAPVVYLVIGYMGAGMLAPADRRGQPALQKFLADEVQNAAE